MKINEAALRLVVCIAAALPLQACGGDGSNGPQAAAAADPNSISVPPSTWSTPIVYNFAAAGQYRLTVTGQFTVTQFSGPDSLGVWFDYSGQGQIVGSAEPAYAVTAKDQVIAINQTITLTVKEAGPWQMRIALRSWSFGGVMSNLSLQTVKL